MRVAISFPPLRVSRDFIDYPYFADLGAVQAAAVLRQAGLDVVLLDALARPGSTLTEAGSELDLGEPLESYLDAVRALEADVVLMAYSPFHRPPSRAHGLSQALEVLRQALPGAPIWLADLYQSGQHYVDAPAAEVLAAYPEIDGYLRYEAETRLAALVQQWQQAGRGGERRVLHGGETAELDALPIPAWDLLDVPAYFELQAAIVRGLGRPSWAFPLGRALPLVTSRGCPFRCAHCSSNPGLAPGAPKRQRRLAPARLREVISALRAEGAERVHVLDELANVSERHFDALLDALCEHELAFEIPNGLRADYVLPEHLERMRGRLTTLSVSAESGVQRVVDEVVSKDLDLSAIARVAERARDAGVALLVHFMIGLPGESAEEVNATLAFALDLHERFDAWPSVQFATPLPGTRLAEHARGALPVLDWGPRFQQRPSALSRGLPEATLRAFKETFDLRLAASGGPKKAIMNVTYRCNNHCTFCAVGTRTQVDGNFERQRELLVKYRQQGVRLLDLDGGEPTLNERLFALIRFARKLGYEKVNVTTNGRMAAYEAYARELVRSGVTSVLFSLHGHEPWLHAANVGVPEAFEQTLAGIANVQRLAEPELELGANVTVTLSNHKHLVEIADLVHALGLRWLNIQFLTPFGRATSTVCPDLHAAAEQTMRVIDRHRDTMKLAVINAPWCALPGYEQFVAADLLKLERHMLFVDNEEVNLFEYLREQREYRAECAPCPRRVFCGGFYKESDVAEPTWLIAPEDLVRRIEPAGKTGPARERGRA